MVLYSGKWTVSIKYKSKIQGDVQKANQQAESQVSAFQNSNL